MSTPNDIQALLASIRPRPSPTSMAGHGPDAPNPSAPPPPHYSQYPGGFPQQQQQHQQHVHQLYDGQAFPSAAAAHMRQQQQHQQHQQQQHQQHLAAPGYRHPSVTTIHSPSPLHNHPPHRSSDILSPNASTPRVDMFPPSEQSADRAGSLLSLLKSNQGAAAAAATETHPASIQHQSPTMPFLPQDQETGHLGDEPANQSHARNISASDFVASLFGGGGRQAPAAPAVPQPTAVPAGFPYEQPGSSVGVEESPSSNTPNPEKEMLLRLLNRSKPSPDAGGDALRPAKSMSQSPASVSPAKSPVQDPFMSGARSFEEALSGKPDVASSNAPKSHTPSKESLFTYVDPFQQLAAASPRNRTPQPKSRSDSPAVEVLKTQEPSIAALMESIASGAQETEAPSQHERSESPELADEQRDAINSVVGQMVEQIGRELDGSAGLPAEKKTKEPPVLVTREENAQEVLSSVADNLLETAAEAKQDSAEETVEEFVKEEVTTTTTTAVPVKEATQSKENGDALPDNWESSAEETAKDEGRVVYVHNFPLKPFISIVVRPNTGKLATLRDDDIMDIARLKKEFDQLDRSLTSATSEYIVYALAKNGGMRIIRQEDGSDKQVFRSTRDRVFNVALSASHLAGSGAGSTDEQALLGIGVSGTVYWALVSRPERDLFELDALESDSLVFPPFPASDENTSGGQLKTRAKRSSRHPGFFAIGRGKNIYVISPHAAMDTAYGVSGTQRTVNTEKFFKERALKISTGKAGKDFMFSDDDSVIASLDKTGRLRFWDIRDVANNATGFFANPPNPAEVRVPLSTFVTGSPAEKSWPTSVLFIDKLRPYVKSIALRYVLVGLKQNHTLQLWDIGLGKAVQELKFPHENESDAICSVAYHAASGIIVIGHPTRNSIYFVHLSAPRYMLPAMSQASFVKRASEKDVSLPKPESTACMSGIRELSFASKGQLRSLDLLPINKSSAGDKRGVDESHGLFELYVMHSRGVTCLNIKKEDLGWSADNRIMHPVNALGEGLIEINELETFPAPAADEPSINGDTSSTPTKVAPKVAADVIADIGVGAGTSRTQSPSKPVLKKKLEEPAEPVTLAPPTNGTEKPEKKKKRKGTGASAAAGSEGAPKVKDVAFTESPSAPPTQKAEQSNGSVLYTSQPAATLPSGPTHFSGSDEFWNKHMETLQSGVSGEFNKTLGREIEGLYDRFNSERRKWDEDSVTKQDQILRLVSSTLSDNVEKNLTRIVSNSIQTEVVPTLTDATSKHLNDVVARQLGGVIPREIHQALPEAIGRAVQQPDVMRVMSDAVAQKLGSHVQGEVTKALHNTINPAMKNFSLRAAEKVGTDMEKQMQAQMKQFEVQRHNDSAKIDQLTTLVRGLSDTVASMAATQTGFQNEVLRLNHVVSARDNGGRQSVQPSVSGPVPTAPIARSESTRVVEDIELAEIAQLMNHGRFEEGSVKWLQSSQQADLFDNLFVRMNPSYLTSLSPIVALSVGVAVTSSLETNIVERLAWLDVVLYTVDLRDADIREVAPKIMDILTQRLESLYLTAAQNNPHDPIIRRIAPLSRRARELRGV